MKHDEFVELFGLLAADMESQVLVYGRQVPEATQTFSQPVIHYFPKPDSTLPFADFTFDLALCLDYLFMDEDHQSVEFHLQQIVELARVAKEVRIFPLSDADGFPSPLLGPVLLGLQQENYGVEVRDVTSSFRPNGNAMLRVWAQQCHVN